MSFTTTRAIFTFVILKTGLFLEGEGIWISRQRTTTDFAINEKIKKALEQQLKEIVLPNQKVEIEDWWAGIMAFGDDKRPILKKHGDKIILGVRLGGMGVAIGSRLGETISEMILVK